MPWIVTLVLLTVAFLSVAFAYNRLVRSRETARAGWNQIDVQLQRRHDLIPNLVETARAYMTHEQETLENVVRARQRAVDARAFQERTAAENELSRGLGQLLLVWENYPELKADARLSELHEELVTTENRIGFARQHYNDVVLHHNQLCEAFPWCVLASTFGIERADYFGLDERAPAREATKVRL